ncbi:flagellar basal body L-ring protein FlgH [Pelagicoccus sp. SDUM812005]|uniref:flagellar basal body L-ring protein FlgH n=1 Tax=Pelagicoccus sp. SDUM812005 TaxID=3041257 RepID=UPI00280EFFB8|nr:flagellar basal body L-ring protein FlgH [Pelagicoccus sp. SDUM812005]MDQ8182321.1 flagellar basal body L-ring protein FlgH [Pelagicoccus sp. SDUM812005]
MRIRILITCALVFAGAVFGKSLWESPRNTERGMFADRTAAGIGDILTVEVDEETIANRSTSKSSGTSSTLNHAIDSIVIPRVFNSANETLPSVNLGNPQESFNGSGSLADSNLLQSKIAVMVVDVQPNGNLLIEGARKIKSSGEAQYLVVRGIVRGDDVESDNTISSFHVLNASIELFSEGDLKNAQTKGWIQRLVDVTNVL